MTMYIVAYDVNTPHQGAVKAKLQANGFGNLIPVAPSGHRQLPDTTLAVNAASPKEALTKFKTLAVSAATGVVVERVVAVEATQYSIDGEAYP
ncbi:hypothetical protein HUA78_30460 [Myxococcus sp. CA033]|uniref:hypothetical protein n=1 Tax=Myxococcus sp. CA033 TaxID=2741516 RepID=UPI00157B1AB7|nr:hypothetical protein [Myxococcus sp. CA033]NTX38776.1 hypothetical protein [Myxococcus sp. CA033]